MLSSLFSRTPMAKRRAKEKDELHSALYEKIQSELAEKQANAQLRKARKVAAATRQINYENHFSPRIEALYTKGKTS